MGGSAQGVGRGGAIVGVAPRRDTYGRKGRSLEKGQVSGIT